MLSTIMCIWFGECETINKLFEGVLDGSYIEVHVRCNCEGGGEYNSPLLHLSSID